MNLCIFILYFVFVVCVGCECECACLTYILDVGLVGGDIVIHGDNFGNNASAVSLSVQNSTCNDLRVVNDSIIVS